MCRGGRRPYDAGPGGHAGPGGQGEAAGQGNFGAWQPVPGGGDYDPDQTMHVSFAAQLPPEPRPGEDPLGAHGPAGPPGEARDGWKVLRALGGLMQLPGFEFDDLAGLRDGVISPQSALRAATAVRHSKTVLFEDEGHFMAEERPRRLAREVGVFLGELADYETNGGEWR